ncbi:MAG: hypothetical protein AAGA48_22355 [Myxococcota bacterium]
MREVLVQPSKLHYAPGDTIDVTVTWTRDPEPEAVTVRLLWRTSGRGDTDVALASEQALSPAESVTTVTFTAPQTPPSFSGQLITLQWTIEAEVQPGDGFAHADIVIGPDGHEVQL